MRVLAAVAMLALAAAALALALAAHEYASAEVFVFSKVLGFDAPPGSDAIRVRRGRIVEIGRERSLGRGRRVRRFAGLVAVPGFRDADVRVALSCAALSSDAVLAPEDWTAALGRAAPAVPTRAAFEAGLRRAADAERAHELTLVFGHHAPTHGPLDRRALDAAVPRRPCAVLSRGCGAFVLNGAALTALGYGMGDHGDEVATGVFAGAAAVDAARRVFSGTAGRRRLAAGASLLVSLLSARGVCSVTDASGSPRVVRWARQAFASAPVRVRFALDPFPAIAALGPRRAGPAIARALSREPARDAPAAWAWPPLVSLRVDEPCASGGHQMKAREGGAWALALDDVDALSRAFLSRGYGVRYETHGDFGLDVALGQLQRRAFERATAADAGPRVEVLAGFADGRDAASKLAALRDGGLDVRLSVDAGLARTADNAAAPLASLAASPAGLHSSMPCGGSGPCDPLACAAAACSREGDERVSRADALRLLCRPLGAGDDADVTLLSGDPLAEGFERVRVWGVLLGGVPRASAREVPTSSRWPRLALPAAFEGGACDRTALADAIVACATR